LWIGWLITRRLGWVFDEQPLLESRAGAHERDQTRWASAGLADFEPEAIMVVSGRFRCPDLIRLSSVNAPVELARWREKPLKRIAADLGISESCVRGWIAKADVEDGRRPA
jgi:hypothetical protein